MTHPDMTIEELLSDPLVNLMMRADGVSARRIRCLLADATARMTDKHQTASVD